MKDNQQPARTGTDSDTVLATNCSICRGRKADKREAINRALAQGMSYRDIEALTGVAYRTVGNHAAHLPDIYRQARQHGILNQAVDVYAELREQLSFAKDLRMAARRYLSDPVTGELTLLPRSDEITVVYEDYNDRNAQNEPKRKRDSLDYLLSRAAAPGKINPLQIITRHVDLRSFALDAIRTADTVIDKFARIEGSYQKDNQQKTPVNSYIEVKLYLIGKAREQSGGDLEKALLIYDQMVRSAIEAGQAMGKNVSADDFVIEARELAMPN